MTPQKQRCATVRPAGFAGPSLTRRLAFGQCQKLLATNRSLVSTFQRAVLGAVIAGHGFQKLLGWFGGGGWDGTQAYFASQGIPAALGALIILCESLGALALIAGLLTRINAAGIAAIMAGTIWFEHGKNGFFMNWFGQMRGEGYEYALVVLALALPLVVTGGGRWSLDSTLARSTP